MNESDHPPMAPEVFVRLRMLGFTTAGLWAIQRKVKMYTPESWAVFLDMLDNLKPDVHTLSVKLTVDYWNNHRLAKEHTNG